MPREAAIVVVHTVAVHSDHYHMLILTIEAPVLVAPCLAHWVAHIATAVVGVKKIANLKVLQPAVIELPVIFLLLLEQTLS